MKKTFTKLSLIGLLLLPVTMAYSQVTIGSGNAPEAGALLQLKENENKDANANKGMMLPRVQLTDANNLYPMFEVSPNSGTANSSYNTQILKTKEDSNHIGLIVYNTNICSLLGRGIYVWNGEEWIPINVTPRKFSLSNSTYDFNSGSDLRGNVNSQNLTLAYPADIVGLGYSITNTLGGGLKFLTNPLVTSPIVQNPITILLRPDAISIPDVTNPWHSRETNITFVDPNCGASETIRMNQTNFGLRVNWLFADSKFLAMPDSISIETNGNVEWEAILKSDPNSIINTTTTNLNIIKGSDLKNGNTNSIPLDITFNPYKRYYSAVITFQDANLYRRFNDINVTVKNCAITSEPTMVEWVKRAGFSNVSEKKISDTDDINNGINTPNTTTGIAWHRDQSGNIFLSASFDATNVTGNTERWMITNLAATQYASAVAHAYGRTISGSLIPACCIYSYTTWAYPENQSNNSYLKKEPRSGLLYTWDLATAGKGGPTGQNNFVSTEINNSSQVQIQGICPNGWHLPSDYEWTVLENKIIANTHLFSSQKDIGGTPINGQTTTNTARRTHGPAMSDSCKPFTSKEYIGTSNTINTAQRPGMNFLLNGYGYHNMNLQNNIVGNYFSSSGKDIQHVLIRTVAYNSQAVYSAHFVRDGMCSVRCKKNP